MLYRKPITLVVGAAFAAYHAGEHFHFYEPSPPVPVLATAASTGSLSMIGTVNWFHPTSLAILEPPPPIVPPNQKFEQS
jgi:hypothetical protein